MFVGLGYTGTYYRPGVTTPCRGDTLHATRTAECGDIAWALRVHSTMGPAGMNGFAIGNWQFEPDKFNLVVRVARCNRRKRDGSTATSAKYRAWFIGASERKQAR